MCNCKLWLIISTQDYGGRERISRASPKSAILITSMPMHNKFSGLRSRWKKPDLCIYKNNLRWFRINAPLKYIDLNCVLVITNAKPWSTWNIIFWIISSGKIFSLQNHLTINVSVSN